MDKENGPGYIPSTLRDVKLRDVPKAIVGKLYGNYVSKRRF